MIKRSMEAGEKHGRLTAVRFMFRSNAGYFWEYSCDCGGSITVRAAGVRNGNTKSCGCLRREISKSPFKNYRHGMSDSSEYRIWAHMVRRCRKVGSANYASYGARGINVCERWLEFKNFIADVGCRPSSKHSLDRYPDNNGNYEPGNVRWATPRQQSANRRNSIFIMHDGNRIALSDAAISLGVNYQTLYSRYRNGVQL